MTGDGTFQIRKGDYRARLISFLDEELQLHPKAVAWVRDNIRYIEIGIVAFVVGLLAWNGWDYYHQSRMVKSANALTAARAVEEPEERAAAMKKVAQEFAGTASGTWAALELAHDAFDRGEFEAAAAAYEKILDDMDADYPARMPVLYRLALSLENSGKTGAALKRYQELARAKGFAYLGDLAAGRLLEAKKDIAAALEAYKDALAAVPEQGEEHDFLTVKVAELQRLVGGKGGKGPAAE